MKKSSVIVVTGLPCAGKSTIAAKIARQFSLPLIQKDGIKEALFDSLGWKDRDWSKKLSYASYEIMYHFMEQMLTARQSFLVEGNFTPRDHNEKFQKLEKKFGFQVLQIICRAEGEILFQRFKDRHTAGERHPGHVDQLTFEEMEPLFLKGNAEPLDIGGVSIEIDTIDFNNIDYELLFLKISAWL